MNEGDFHNNKTALKSSFLLHSINSTIIMKNADLRSFWNLWEHYDVIVCTPILVLELFSSTTAKGGTGGRGGRGVRGGQDACLELIFVDWAKCSCIAFENIMVIVLVWWPKVSVVKFNAQVIRFINEIRLMRSDYWCHQISVILSWALVPRCI